MRWATLLRDRTKDDEPYISPSRAQRSSSKEEWTLVLGREPRPGEVIFDLVLEALVRLAERP